METLKNVKDLGYSHCDLKPENILVTGNKFILIDFGASTKFDDQGRINFNTRQGTFNTISPE